MDYDLNSDLSKKVNDDGNVDTFVARSPQPQRQPSRPPQPPRPPMDGMWISNGVIEEVTSERDTVFATVVYRERPRSGEQTVTLVVSGDTRIFDVNRRRLRPRELQVGMVIDAFISTAMTRSIPPQARAFEIFVIERQVSRQETVGRIVQVNTRENYILTISGNNTVIRFNIGPETVILDLFGRRMRLSDLFTGLRVRVEHATFMTASIPPQTLAFVIQVIR